MWQKGKESLMFRCWHIIENIVFLELKRRGYKVNIGKLMENEIDFIASDMNERAYYKVSASVLDSNTLERERSPRSQASHTDRMKRSFLFENIRNNI